MLTFITPTSTVHKAQLCAMLTLLWVPFDDQKYSPLRLPNFLFSPSSNLSSVKRRRQMQPVTSDATDGHRRQTRCPPSSSLLSSLPLSLTSISFSNVLWRFFFGIAVTYGTFRFQFKHTVIVSNRRSERERGRGTNLKTRLGETEKEKRRV